MELLTIRPKETACWDLVALGEVMLRFDPRDRRISTARSFDVYEGGGEYNVARGLKRCFGMNTAVVTALADNPVGRLVEDFILQGGVDTSLIRWMEYDGVGRSVRNGLNFVEHGFGLRAAVGCSDRGNTAASQLARGQIDWDEVFGKHGARWLHTGGIFCGLSNTAPDVALEAIEAARRHGVIVSYDLNYRPSLWKAAGGKKQAQEVNRRIAPLADVLLGNEEDFSAALGFDVDGADESFSQLNIAGFQRTLEKIAREFSTPVVAATLRKAITASRNDWGALCLAGGTFYQATERKDLEIYDRVGGGDAFASGLIYGFLTGQPPQWSVECGAAHGALAMTTPGDTSMATLNEVLQVMQGQSARIAR
jgi:2-dehydro-3-deoxygluconokinase